MLPVYSHISVITTKKIYRIKKLASFAAFYWNELAYVREQYNSTASGWLMI